MKPKPSITRVRKRNTGTICIFWYTSSTYESNSTGPRSRPVVNLVPFKRQRHHPKVKFSRVTGIPRGRRNHFRRSSVPTATVSGASPLSKPISPSGKKSLSAGPTYLHRHHATFYRFKFKLIGQTDWLTESVARLTNKCYTGLSAFTHDLFQKPAVATQITRHRGNLQTKIHHKTCHALLNGTF